MSKPNIEHARHTLAHLLAQAALENYPSAQLTLGPAVDNGFYYDIDFGTEKISDTDLPKLEKTMRKKLPSWKEFTHEEVSRAEALARFKGNPFKSALIQA